MTMGDRIAVFRQGRIEQLGAPLALYQQPANEFVAGFIGAPRINLLDRPGAQASAAHRQLWQQLGGESRPTAQRLGLRPEHLQLAEGGVPASVVLAEHLGDVSIVHLRVDGVPELLTAKLAGGAAALQSGASVGLLASAEQTLAFDAAGQRLG
jgi:multiple sugar transport system ATP-binding protein